jgi:hypothetical protein
MKTKEIPKNEWPEFFDSFSRKHEGWLVNVEILGPQIGAQVEVRDTALEGITDEWDEVEGNTIMIMTGAQPAGHMTHSITHPMSVSLEQTDEGDDAALAIKSNDGTTTLLRFRAAVLPELVDAVAA